MNNNIKINPIFKALGDVEERHVPVNEKKRPGKKIKIALIAVVSAAALAMIVGFVGTSGGKHKFSFGDDDSLDRGFYLDLTPQQFTVPDEFKPLPGEVDFSGNVDMPPSELFAKFGIELPTGENFTKVLNKETTVELYMPNGVPDDLKFWYVLHNNTIDEDVYFHALYFANADRTTYSYHWGLMPGEPSEIITLNNGSLCMVSASMAVFSYNGAQYEFTLPYEYDEPDNFGDLPRGEQKRILAELVEAMPGIDTVKQVLTDLGVYDSE